MSENAYAASIVPNRGEIPPESENNIGTALEDGQAADEHICVTPLSGPAAAVAIARGVSRHLRALNCAVLAELTLAGGRRCDLMALDERGGIAIVEIKSCLADFRADRKWPAYRDWCDRFYFAVDADFPRRMIPEDCGLILADSYGAEILREAPAHPLAAPRRKALTLRFARYAGFRLQEKDDPDPGTLLER
jgi:hypothetical protein